MQFDIIMQKIAQIAVLLSSGVLYLLAQMDITIIEKAFDQLFSLGLLCLFAYMLYREWKGAQQYNEKRDKKFEELVANNTQAMKDFRTEIRTIHDRIDRNERRIEKNRGYKQSDRGDS